MAGKKHARMSEISANYERDMIKVGMGAGWVEAVALMSERWRLNRGSADPLLLTEGGVGRDGRGGVGRD